MANLDQATSLLDLQCHLAIDRGIDLPNRRINLIGDITEKTVKSFDGAMSILEHQDSDKPITVVISSVGGDTYAAMAIVARIRKATCSVFTQVQGYCLSAAVAIFAAGAHRSADRYSTLMIHPFSYDSRGKSTDHKAMAKQVQREEEIYCEILEEYTGTSKEIWLKTMRQRHDSYFRATELVSYNLVQEII